MNNKLAFFIPAAGYGTRMLPLTKYQAKPSLPLYFDDNYSIYRMIDFVLNICEKLNGMAYITSYYKKESLYFLEKRNVKILTYDKPDIDYSLYQSLSLLEKSKADILCYLPADTMVPIDVVKRLIHMVDEQTYAALLCTHYLKDHNIRLRSSSGMLTKENGEPCGDLGIYAINLKYFLREAEKNGKIDILRGWEKSQWMNSIKLFIPENEEINHVDLGTPSSYFEAVMKLNSEKIDSNGNLIFPGAKINNQSKNSIALPNSDSTKFVLEHSIIPEGIVTNTIDDVLMIENAEESFGRNIMHLKKQ